jgi:hypothetical protein
MAWDHFGRTRTEIRPIGVMPLCHECHTMEHQGTPGKCHVVRPGESDLALRRAPSQRGADGGAQIPVEEVGWMAVKQVAHPSVAERIAKGRQARTVTPPSSHTGWRPAADRPRSGGPARHERIGPGRRHDPARTDVLRAHLRVDPWPVPTPAPETRSPSPNTWAEATRSTSRSPGSPNATPTKTRRTTSSSPARSGPGGWKPSKASEDRGIDDG